MGILISAGNLEISVSIAGMISLFNMHLRDSSCFLQVNFM